MDPSLERSRAILRFGLFGLLLYVPLPFGSVEPGSVFLLQIVAAWLGVLSLWIVFRQRVRPSRRWSGLASLFALIVALGCLQLVPLPPSVVRLVAGPTAEAREALAPSLGLAIDRLAPLSLSPPDTLDALLRLVAYGLIGFAASLAIRSRRHLLQAASILLVTGTFQAIYGAAELISGRQQIFGFVKKHYLDSATGTFINRNHFSGYLAMILPIALALLVSPGRRSSNSTWRQRLLALADSRGQLRLLAAFATASLWIGVILSYSRAGLVLALIGSLLTARLLSLGRRRTALLALAILLPTAFLMTLEIRTPGERLALLNSEVSTPKGRLVIWRATSGILADYPLLGTGWGTFEHAFPSYRPPAIVTRWDHAHNDWLQAATEGGLVLPGLLLLSLIGVLREREARFSSSKSEAAVMSAAAAAIVVCSLHALVDFGLRIPAIGVTLAFLVGVRMAPGWVSNGDAVVEFEPPSARDEARP